MNYPMYGNNQYYMQDLQAMRDRIDSQMRQLQQQNQMSQTPQQITQNFQLAPTQNGNEFDAKYANNIDEVKNTLALRNTFFVNKEMNTLWFKNASGDIKTYTLAEVIELDPKDQEIANLKKQIEDMKNMVMNQNNNASKETIIENKIDKKK